MFSSRKSSVARTREDGFTLIELLVVVIIIAILAAVAVPVYVGLQTKAKHSAIQADVATTKTNIAAALTEDGTVSSGSYITDAQDGDAHIQNSGMNGDEVVKVTVNPDSSFTVEAGSEKLGFYDTYDSATGSHTESAQSSVPKGTVALDFEGAVPADGTYWNSAGTGSEASAEKAHSGTHSLRATSNSIGSYTGAVTPGGLVAGKTYTVTAYVYTTVSDSSQWWETDVNIYNARDTSGGYDTTTYLGTGQNTPLNSWVKITKTVVVGSGASINLTAGIANTQDGTSIKAYIDDVTFTPVN